MIYLELETQEGYTIKYGSTSTSTVGMKIYDRTDTYVGTLNLTHEDIEEFHKWLDWADMELVDDERSISVLR